MRFFVVAADVAMGVFLGIFLFAVLVRLFPAFDHPLAGLASVAAAVLVVLFRRPNGSLAARRSRGDR